MKFHEPITHWNNFTVPQLKDILKHCAALEKLGIAQDEEMIVSIERDLNLRGKEMINRYVQYQMNSAKKKNFVQSNFENSRSPRKVKQPSDRRKDNLLEQTA